MTSTTRDVLTTVERSTQVRKAEPDDEVPHTEMNGAPEEEQSGSRIASTLTPDLAQEALS